MNKVQRSLTYSLFVRPSFLSGVARIFDFSGSLQMYLYSRTHGEADRRALASDWKMVGKDIELAIELYGEEQEKN